jgi:hypothetical protein
MVSRVRRAPIMAKEMIKAGKETTIYKLFRYEENKNGAKFRHFAEFAPFLYVNNNSTPERHRFWGRTSAFNP